MNMINQPHQGKALAAKLAWILVWVALGAMGGTLYWKVVNRNPPPPAPEPPPVVLEPAPGPYTPPEPEIEPGWTEEFNAGSGDTMPGSDYGAGGTAEEPPAYVDEPPPTMTTSELDRELVKKTVYDYYAAISRNDVDAASALWFNPDQTTKHNIRAAADGYDQIVVEPESLTVVKIDGPEAEVTFTIKAYLKSGKYHQIKKEATLVRKDGQWLLARTGNPK